MDIIEDYTIDIEQEIINEPEIILSQEQHAQALENYFSGSSALNWSLEGLNLIDTVEVAGVKPTASSKNNYTPFIFMALISAFLLLLFITMKK